MRTRIVIDGNTAYEIDEECLECMERREREKQKKEGKKASPIASPACCSDIRR